MLISPVKSIRKPPLIEPVKLGKLSDSANALGNSIQLTNTKAGNLKVLQVLGETVGKKAVFGTATVTVTGVASLPFIAGASITFSGFATTANNKTVTLTSISGLVLTFPAATFTAATELQGTITDGTNTVNIAVSPTATQILTSLTNFDYVLRNRNLISCDIASQTINGITITKATDGTFTFNGTASAGTSLIISDNQSLPLKNQTYILKVCGQTFTSMTMQLSYTDGVNVIDSALLTGKTFTPDITKRIKKLTIWIPSGTVFSNVKFSPQLEVGATANTYEPYQGVTATIALKDTLGTDLDARGIPATYNAGGTVATWAARDYVFKDTDGKWKLSQIDFSKTISEGALFSAEFANTVRVRVPHLTQNVKTDSNGISNYLKSYVNWGSDTEHFYFNSADINLFINKSRLATPDAAGVNAFLAANPFICIGYLNAPVITELHADNQSAFNAVAHSFDGTTNIMLSTDIGQVYVELSQWSDSAKR
jgi:hypothetical protein